MKIKKFPPTPEWIKPGARCWILGEAMEVWVIDAVEGGSVWATRERDGYPGGRELVTKLAKWNLEGVPEWTYLRPEFQAWQNSLPKNTFIV